MNRSVAIAVLCIGALRPAAGVAAVSDEIQVYAADTNHPGAFGLELHLNTTPAAVASVTIRAKRRRITVSASPRSSRTN